MGGVNFTSMLGLRKHNIGGEGVYFSPSSTQFPDQNDKRPAWKGKLPTYQSTLSTNTNSSVNNNCS